MAVRPKRLAPGLASMDKKLNKIIGGLKMRTKDAQKSKVYSWAYDVVKKRVTNNNVIEDINAATKIVHEAYQKWNGKKEGKLPKVSASNRMTRLGGYWRRQTNEIVLSGRQDKAYGYLYTYKDKSTVLHETAHALTDNAIKRGACDAKGAHGATVVRILIELMAHYKITNMTKEELLQSAKEAGVKINPMTKVNRPKFTPNLDKEIEPEPIAKPFDIKKIKISKLTREQYLEQAMKELTKLLSIHTEVPKDMRVSCGLPNGQSGAIGQAWPRSRSSKGINEIFISPEIDNSETVLHVLMHEMIHGCLDCEHGHKGPIKRIALAVGLTGKMTATVAGSTLKIQLQEVIKKLGKYPHNELDTTRIKTQTTRNILIECTACSAKFRTSRKTMNEAIISMSNAHCPFCNKTGKLISDYLTSTEQEDQWIKM